MCSHYGIKAYIHKSDLIPLVTDTLGPAFGFGSVSVEEEYLEAFDLSIASLPDVKCINLPGHSEGSVIFIIENRAFTGDVLFKNGVGRTDLTGGQPGEMKNSLNIIKTLPDELIIFPGHGVSGILKNIKKENPSL